MQKRSLQEIKVKNKKRDIQVFTASEVKTLIEEKGVEKAFREVDVVTTGTFGSMCSSGVFINLKQPSVPIKINHLLLNDVPAFCGIAAADAYIGATEPSISRERYGGSHVIEELIRGKDIEVKAKGVGTDCYPCRSLDTTVNINELNQAIIYNPRNLYQNYAAATNGSSKTLYTYMGKLLAGRTNVTYATSGEISPLICAPELEGIGPGTKIFLAGAQGFITGTGTQSNPARDKTSKGIPELPGLNLAVTGNLKECNEEFLSATYYEKYGPSLGLGIGVPIPVLNERILERCGIRNNEIIQTLFDYSQSVSSRTPVGKFSYEELSTGTIVIENNKQLSGYNDVINSNHEEHHENSSKKARTSCLSSIHKSEKICHILKKKIQDGEFIISGDEIIE